MFFSAITKNSNWEVRLRMKIFNILGVHRKMQLFLGGYEKPIYRGGLPKNEGLNSLQILVGAWQKRAGGVFEGSWYPNAHYVKLFLDRFLKNQNWAYPWMNSLKFCEICFYCMPSWGLSKYIETKLQTTCFLPHMKVF